MKIEHVIRDIAAQIRAIDWGASENGSEWREVGMVRVALVEMDEDPRWSVTAELCGCEHEGIEFEDVSTRAEAIERFLACDTEDVIGRLLARFVAGGAGVTVTWSELTNPVATAEG